MRPFAAVILLALSTTAMAGPWVRDPGAGYAKLGWRGFQSDNGMVSGESTGLKYTSHTVGLYSEIGIPGQLQLTVDLPFVSATHASPDGVKFHHRWTGDLRVQLDRRLTKAFPLSLGLEVRLPTYGTPADRGRAAGLDDELFESFVLSFPELGDPNVDLTLKLAWGASIPRGWVKAEIGPRLRIGPYADGVMFASGVGVWIVPERLGAELYASANVNLFAGADNLANREILFTQIAVFGNPSPTLPLSISATFGVLPVAVDSSQGGQVGLALSTWWDGPDKGR